MLETKIQKDPSQHQLSIMLSKYIVHKMKLVKQNFFNHAIKTEKMACL